MSLRYSKHYTREEARALLPQVRLWLGRLANLRGTLKQQEVRIQGLMAPGCDLGGSLINNWLRSLVEIRELVIEFEQRQIQIKDLDRGLLDFPALIGGREVFLCWEKDEEDIEFWHELDGGFACRERL
jgi:hypothetical protein